MDIPKLFISYSHDSLPHKKWVLDLATRLRSSGIDAILDQWELTPGDDIPHFMETHLASADYIAMICTDRYVGKANSGSGGVGYEKMIITSNLMNRIDENKIIPIIRQNGTYNLPTFLKTKLFIDFSKNDDFEYNLDDLIRKVHQSPIFKKPPVGHNPFDTSISSKPQPKHDALQTLMKIVVDDYEKGESYSKYFDIAAKLKISRIMLDLLILEAISNKYIRQDSDKDIFILDAGRFYALQNVLIK
jgi:TIR domain